MARVDFRFRALLIALLSLGVFDFSMGDLLQPSAFCVDGCHEALDYVTFEPQSGGPPATAYYDSKCSNPLVIKSLYYCISVYCSQSEIEAGLKYENGTCKKYAAAEYRLPAYDSVMGAADNGFLNSIERVSLLNISTDAYDHPVIPSADFFEQGRATTVRI